MMFFRKKQPEPDDRIAPANDEQGDARETRNGGSSARIRNVHWRTVDVAPELFVRVRDQALLERDGEDPRRAADGLAADDETIAWLLDVCDYEFISSFKSSPDTPLPEPQRPEGQMRQFGLLPLGIAPDRDLGGDALYVLVKYRECQVQVPPYLRHDVWRRLVSILGNRLRRDLHIVLLGTGGRVVERAIDFFYYQVEIRDADAAEVAVAAEPLSIDVQTGDPPQIAQARFWLREAVNSRASDIHMEPGDGAGRLRMRVDGELVVLQDRIAPGDLTQVITWIKAQARMDISERRRPLDGGIRLTYLQEDTRRLVDVRVSTIPTIYGQKMVMRLLDPETLRSLAARGLQGTVWYPPLLQKFQFALESRDGIVLVTGPTGSGKTTTLNSGLFHLLDMHVTRKNIVTIEDPVEYNVAGCNQIQVNEAAGVTFSRALRSILRQDPDIVLVGEIRDQDTATVAIQAALTGHLILATLHTNDALGAVDRLQDLGVSPFLIASTVRLFQAQRLVRTLCPRCGKDAPLNRDALARKVRSSRLQAYLDEFMAMEQNVYDAKGCSQCNYTGYAGRKTVMEMATMSPELAKGIEERASARELAALARHSGYRPMVENGLELIRSGLTTISEIESISLTASAEDSIDPINH